LYIDLEGVYGWADIEIDLSDLNAIKNLKFPLNELGG
jgi:hypothetical protein